MRLRTTIVFAVVDNITVSYLATFILFFPVICRVWMKLQCEILGASFMPRGDLLTY